MYFCILPRPSHLQDLVQGIVLIAWEHGRMFIGGTDCETEEAGEA